MGTLYIDRKELHIRLDGNALAFYSNEKREGLVPISPLKRVIMVGNISIETSVLHRLSNEGISVLFLSGKRHRYCGVFHGRLHNNGILRVKQYEKSLSPFSSKISIEIVRRKICGQKEFLEEVMGRRPDLRFPLFSAIGVLDKSLRNLDTFSGSMDSLRGIEGGVATTYFRAYTTMFPEALGFKGRQKRPPKDPVNAMLSFCYTLLHFEVVREVEVIGLDSTIGFYHQFDYGRESLACDLVELYRPSVDKFVWELFRERIFTARDFAHDDVRPGYYLKKESRRRFFPLYEEWANDIRPKLVNEVRTLSVRIMDGQDALSE